MKTIVYILLGIFFLGIVSLSFTKKTTNGHRILIQSEDTGVSPALLSQSARVISDRLKDFCLDKFDISVVPERNQIQVVFADTWNLKFAENLMVQKGSMAFYETFDQKRLSELLHGDNHLFSLLKTANTNDGNAEIGCVSIPEAMKVEEYLNSSGLNQKCKFGWRHDARNSNACLYALNSDAGTGSFMNGSEIEGVKAEKDQKPNNYSVAVKFKKSAIEKWSVLTKRNINHVIAIVLDNTVISAPLVRSEINGGNCVITGDFDENESKFMAALGNNGELPVSFHVVK